MTFVKHTQGGSAEITPAALALSGLDEHEFFELHALNGAVVMFGADAEPFELVAVVNELVRLAEALMADVLSEKEEQLNEDTIPFPRVILKNAGLEGNEYHVFSDDGIVMIVGKEKEFSLTPETRERLHKHGITPAHFDCLFKRAGEEDD